MSLAATVPAAHGAVSWELGWWLRSYATKLALSSSLLPRGAACRFHQGVSDDVGLSLVETLKVKGVHVRVRAHDAAAGVAIGAQHEMANLVGDDVAERDRKISSGRRERSRCDRRRWTRARWPDGRDPAHRL